MKFSKKFKENALLITFGIVLFFVLVNYELMLKILKYAEGILWPFILGAIIAFILNVPMSAIEKHLFRQPKNERIGKLVKKLKRPVSIILTFLIAVGIVVVLCILVIPALADTITKLSNDVPVLVERISNTIQDTPWLNKLMKNADINKDAVINGLTNWLKNGIDVLHTLDSTVSIATAIFSSVVNFILGLFFSIYILAQKEKLKRQAIKIANAFANEKICYRTRKICRMSIDTFAKFLTGQCCDAAILGTMCALGMFIFGFPNALLIGLLVACTALIPIVGACIGLIVGFLLISVTSFSQAIWFVIFLLCLQQIEGNLIYPKIVGNSVGLPSLWVLFAITVGGNIMGIFGMFLAVPACAVIYCAMSEIVNARIEHKNEMKKLAEEKAAAKENAEQSQE